ncbi:MAG: hypothetical protein M3R16_03655 [Pseudomonadota bacterium]|nr:hypothetical protein [Pseudomonadota bacterium]
MNPRPHLHGKEIFNTGCGHTAMDNRSRAFWQSRSGLRDPPELADIPALAEAIKRTWPR